MKNDVEKAGTATSCTKWHLLEIIREAHLWSTAHGNLFIQILRNYLFIPERRKLRTLEFMDKPSVDSLKLIFYLNLILSIQLRLSGENKEIEFRQIKFLGLKSNPRSKDPK